MFGYLVSFHYYGRQDLDELARSTGREDLTFFADSGAFSAHTLGKEITIESYAEWVGRWQHRLHAYATLDVLFDHKATRRNTQKLRALGLDPMPVFHLGSPMSAYKRYLAECDYVALGGIASGTLKLRDPRLWAYLDQLHEMARVAGVGLHGFGLSSWSVIRGFPWRSCDSSTPGIGYRYGRIQAYDPYADRWFMWDLRDKQADQGRKEVYNRHLWHRHGWLVREYGMAPEDFEGDGPAIREALIQLAARSWSRAASTLERTEVYITDCYDSASSARKHFGMWEEGNRWTAVYVTDAALHQRQGETTRLAALDRGNTWAAARNGARPGATPAAPSGSGAPGKGVGAGRGSRRAERLTAAQRASDA